MNINKTLQAILTTIFIALIIIFAVYNILSRLDLPDFETIFGIILFASLLIHYGVKFWKEKKLKIQDYVIIAISLIMLCFLYLGILMRHTGDWM